MSRGYYYKNNRERDDEFCSDSDDNDQESYQQPYQHRQYPHNSLRNRTSYDYSGKYQNADFHSRDRDRDYYRHQFQRQYHEFSSENTSSDEDCDDWAAPSLLEIQNHAKFVEDCANRKAIPLLYCLFAQDRDTRLFFVKIGTTNRSVESRADWIPLDEATSPRHFTWCCKEDEYLTTTATRIEVRGIGNRVVTESNNGPVPCDNSIPPTTSSVSISQPQKSSLYRRKPQTTIATATTTTTVVTTTNIQKPNDQHSDLASRRNPTCIETTQFGPTGISRREAATKIIDIEQDILDICHEDYPNQAQEASQAFTWGGKTECVYVSQTQPAAFRAFQAILNRINFFYQNQLVETSYQNQFTGNPTR
jgi:hypothetical protein